MRSAKLVWEWNINTIIFYMWVFITRSHLLIAEVIIPTTTNNHNRILCKRGDIDSIFGGTRRQNFKLRSGPVLNCWFALLIVVTDTRNFAVWLSAASHTKIGILFDLKHFDSISTCMHICRFLTLSTICRLRAHIQNDLCADYRRPKRLDHWERFQK